MATLYFELILLSFQLILPSGLMPLLNDFNEYPKLTSTG